MGVIIKEPENRAQACMIWLHGLGANASDMIGLVDQLRVKDVALRHVFLDAPLRPVTLNGGMVMPAWYDIVGMDLVHREDKVGIEQSATRIEQTIKAQCEEGFSLDQIFLAGFSQGGAMAIYTALRTPGLLGGVVALSSYLPMAANIQPLLDKNTPFFLGAGLLDRVVFPSWTQQSKDWLLTQGYASLMYHSYPMEHSICLEEIKDLSLWLMSKVTGVLS